MGLQCVFNPILCLLLAAPMLGVAGGEEFDLERPDTVVVRSGQSGKADQNEGTRRLRGKIVRWQGSALTLMAGSRERQIDNVRIVDVETAWSKSAVEARQQTAVGNFSRAIVLLRQAIQEEQRPWAGAILQADLVRALLATEQSAAACEQFLMLLRDDPNTRFLNIAPLAWTEGSSDASLVGRASEWLKAESPTAQLLAASYLIGTPQQETALETLERLAQDLDQQIAGLAAAQVWRTRKDVDVRVIEEWKQKLLLLPKELRPGPYYVLAKHFEVANQYDEAVTTWMRLPILYEDRPDLAAAALYRVARLMHNTSAKESADLVLQELVRRFPDSAWTQRADRLK
ncbi:tetratricopeptide repeat protein [Mariniblastus sp.]|nr:tetratricopeptide repeat protein [Mariniblastus sp.]